MEDRPQFGDIVACAGLGAMMGAVLIGLGLSIYEAMETGRIDNAGLAIVLVPAALLIAAFTAWPIGTVIGLAVCRIFGWGYWQAAIAGAMTALASGWLIGFRSIARPEVEMLIGLTCSGILSGMLAWHAFLRPSNFNRDQY